MTSTPTVPTEETYGGFSKASSPGILGQGLVGTFVIFGGVAVAIVAMIAGGLFAGMVVFGLVVLVLMPLTVKIGGRSAAQFLLARTVWWRGASSRRSAYRSGALSAIPGGAHSLPGLLAPVQLHEFTTAFGVPFALIEHPHVGLWVTVIRCEPDGAAGLDMSILDARVAGWARFLASLSRLSSVVAAQQVVETAPDTGTRLKAEGERLTSPDAPEIARQMMAEVVDALPTGQATLTSRTAIVWSTPPAVGRRSKAERAQAMAEFVAGYLPGIQHDLLAAGAGQCRPLRGQEVAEELRLAYDPDSVVAIETARGAGTDSTVRWSDCGPVSAAEDWRFYRHDGAVSMTWAMTQPPEGLSYRDVLGPLIDLDSVVTRKRVCLTYKPFSSSEGKRRVKKELRNMIMRSGQDRIGDAADVLEVAAQRQAQEELGKGATLLAFSMHVTATMRMTDDLDFDLVSATIEQAAGDIRLRRCWGHQAAAFTAGLGVGVIPARYLRVPDAVREAM